MPAKVLLLDHHLKIVIIQKGQRGHDLIMHKTRRAK